MWIGYLERHSGAKDKVGHALQRAKSALIGYNPRVQRPQEAPPLGVP
jgi:hypothetical protein